MGGELGFRGCNVVVYVIMCAVAGKKKASRIAEGNYRHGEQDREGEGVYLPAVH